MISSRDMRHAVLLRDDLAPHANRPRRADDVGVLRLSRSFLPGGGVPLVPSLVPAVHLRDVVVPRQHALRAQTREDDGGAVGRARRVGAAENQERFRLVRVRLGERVFERVVHFRLPVHRSTGDDHRGDVHGPDGGLAVVIARAADVDERHAVVFERVERRRDVHDGPLAIEFQFRRFRRRRRGARTLLLRRRRVSSSLFVALSLRRAHRLGRVPLERLLPRALFVRHRLRGDDFGGRSLPPARIFPHDLVPVLHRSHVVLAQALLVHEPLLAREVVRVSHERLLGAVLHGKVGFPEHEIARVVLVVRPLARPVLHQVLAHGFRDVPLPGHRVRGLAPEALRPLDDAPVVHPRARRAEEIERLTLVSRDEPLHCLPAHVVVAVHRVHHVRDVRSRRLPVKLLHAPVAKERRVQRAEVVPGDDDGHSADSLLLSILVNLVVLLVRHLRRVVAQVHQRSHDHLRVHRRLRALKSSHAGVDVVDDEARHLPMVSNDLRRLAVPEGRSIRAMISGWSSKASEAELKGNAGGD
eukprot:30967-Pelagococcus_subviridis.AAC.7